MELRSVAVINGSRTGVVGQAAGWHTRRQRSRAVTILARCVAGESGTVQRPIGLCAVGSRGQVRVARPLAHVMLRKTSDVHAPPAPSPAHGLAPRLDIDGDAPGLGTVRGALTPLALYGGGGGSGYYRENKNIRDPAVHDAGVYPWR